MSAREYAIQSPTFWTGATGQEIIRRGMEATIVAQYLISSPHSNMLGLYRQPLLYMAEETGLGIEGAQKGLQGCMDSGFCAYDMETKMVWIYEMARYQIASSLSSTDKRCKGIQNAYDKLPKCPFLGPFFERYSQAYHLTSRRDFGNPAQLSLITLSEAPYQAPSKPGSGSGSGSGPEMITMLTHGCVSPLENHPPDDPIQGKGEGKPAAKKLPDCPHLALLALWQECMPDMPQHLPSQWKGTRSIHLRARWAETAAEKGWIDQGEGLAYFRKLFAYCRQSAFLSGKVPPRQGFKQFELELAWLVNPTNWAKVLEGKFHGEN